MAIALSLWGETARAAETATCPWPADLDAVAAAPANHRVVLENDRVRVLDVTVTPGEREKVHAHCRKSVMYVMHEGVYRDYDGDGKVIEEVKVAPPASRFPMTLWLEPQGPHAVHNLDARPTRLVRVELKEDGRPAGKAPECPPPAPGVSVPKGRIVIENDRVRVLVTEVAARQEHEAQASCRPTVVTTIVDAQAERARLQWSAHVVAAHWVEPGGPVIGGAGAYPLRLLWVELK